MEFIYFTDESLVEALKNKDENAFKYILDLYGSRILRTCFLVLKDYGMAEDVVQDTFVEVFKSIKKFKGSSALYTWIYRIAVNKCRNILRKTDKETLENETLEFAFCESKEDLLIEKIYNARVKEAVLSLPSIYREVITFFYFEEFSVKEICDILDENENTVKSKLHRGRQKLRDILIKEEVIYEQR